MASSITKVPRVPIGTTKTDLEEALKASKSLHRVMGVLLEWGGKLEGRKGPRVEQALVLLEELTMVVLR